MLRMKGVISITSVLHLCFTLSSLVAAKQKQFNRHDFPPNFIFGAASAAYQVEGAAFEDGRKASIFDTFAHSGRTEGNGDIASDQYHKYKEDVQLMVETGLNAYRFSISWSRLIPDGRGSINPKGLAYYNHLINELISYGIQPHITLFHNDLPQTLEDEYGGFLNRTIIEDFTAYADVCFRKFGDRVMHWTTINEANIFSDGGYDLGGMPPNRCSFPFGINCTKGNSTTEPYLVAHHVLLTHASIVRLYREKYRAKQHGYVGLSLYAIHYIPLTSSREDIIATRRSYDFLLGWFMHPLTHGDYPEVMKRNVGSRIPSFTKVESEFVKGAFDFVGINYYFVDIVQDTPLLPEPRDYIDDWSVAVTAYNDSGAGRGGLPSGQPYPITPWGLQGMLEHFKEVYNNPPIFIYENGQVTRHDASLNDQVRVQYLQAHIGGLLDAVRNGSNTKGYFVWSFLDMFEVLFGSERSYGLYYIDFNDPNLTRYPKLSQRWYSRFLKRENVTVDDDIDDNYEEENISTIIKISHTGAFEQVLEM